MHAFIAYLWHLLVICVELCPWLAVAAAAFLAFRKGAQSWPVVVEIAGAIGAFLVPPVRYTLFAILPNSTPEAIIQGLVVIFAFLEFAMLALFAVGFCTEKLRQARTSRALPAK